MEKNRSVIVNGTIIRVFEDNTEVFQFDYNSLYTLWLQHIQYIPEDEDEVQGPEGYSISIQGKELFIALLECSDQGGILGIVDIDTGKWIHLQEAAYYISGVSNKDWVITLHLVHHYGVIPYFVVQIKSKGCKDFSECDDDFEVPKELKLNAYESYSLSLSGSDLIIKDARGICKSINIEQYLDWDRKG